MSCQQGPGRRRASGVACAGFIDKSGATVLFAPNLAWRDEPLKQRLESIVDIPVIIENDANAAAWGEFTHGVGREADDMVLVTVGTGIGGGVIVDGRLLRGAWGVAAELGHLRVVPDGIRCGCGNRGLLGAVRQRQRPACARRASSSRPGTPLAARLADLLRRRRSAALSGHDVTAGRQGGRPGRAGAAR